MSQNLQLLEKHRQKVWLVFAAALLLFIYIIVFFVLLLIYYIHEIPLRNNIWIILIYIGVSVPIFYSLLAYISCRIMHKIYKPIRRIIENLENFALNINHEFKTSISEILSSLELATMTWKYDTKVPESIISAKRLNSILDGLARLIHFHDVSYRKQKIDIIKILDTCVQDTKESLRWKNISLQKNYNESSKMISHVDPDPLVLCFSNILSNAIRYSKENGIIEIRITQNFFEILDHGVGIEQENLEKIFTRHFRENSHVGGTGIGLSLVRHICELYNWEIDITSEKDKFTCLKIIFA